VLSAPSPTPHYRPIDQTDTASRGKDEGGRRTGPPERVLIGGEGWTAKWDGQRKANGAAAYVGRWGNLCSGVGRRERATSSLGTHAPGSSENGTLTLFVLSGRRGKVHGSLARAGKVKSQTPKVEPQEKKKKVRWRWSRRRHLDGSLMILIVQVCGRAKKRIIYNRRFVNVRPSRPLRSTTKFADLSFLAGHRPGPPPPFPRPIQASYSLISRRSEARGA
jgi:small subunit ribosomal protein S30e